MKTIHQPSYKHFVAKLKEAREAAEITQAGLAKLLRTQQSYVSKVESVERRLDVAEFVDWALAIGAEPTDLIRELVEQVQAATLRTRSAQRRGRSRR